MAKFILGFDPGGQKKFGWAIAEDLGPKLMVIKTGVVSEAHQAIEMVSRILPKVDQVTAAGIDAPLFWGKAGSRQVDGLIRQAVASRGHDHASGTVQDVNSLRGACLVQGVLLASLLNARFDDALITEAHPKALLWLLGIGTDVTLRQLPEFIEIEVDARVNADSASDHERDAVLAAYAGWSMCKQSPGWANVFEKEHAPVQPFGTPVSYWMPLP